MKQSIYTITLFKGCTKLCEAKSINDFIYEIGNELGKQWRSDHKENLTKNYRIVINNMRGWFYITGEELYDAYCKLFDIDSKEWNVDKKFSNKGATMSIKVSIKPRGNDYSATYETYIEKEVNNG